MIRFTYDALGRQLSERDALGNTSTSTYDILGQRATSTAPDGTTTGYAYDGLGRQVGVDYPEPDADVSISYDARGQRVRMTDGLGATTWTYDDLGRATEILDPFGKTVSYGYDGHSNRTRLSYPDGKAANYAYDGLDRLETVTGWNNGVTGYTYTAIGQLVQVGLPNGVTSAYAYDPAGRLASIEHQRGETLLSSFAYSYNPAGNRSGVVERVRGLAEVELPAGWEPPAQFSAGEQGMQRSRWAGRRRPGRAATGWSARRTE